MLSKSFRNSFLSGAVSLTSPIVLSVVLKSLIMVLVLAYGAYVKFTWNAIQPFLAFQSGRI